MKTVLHPSAWPALHPEYVSATKTEMIEFQKTANASMHPKRIAGEVCDFKVTAPFAAEAAGTPGAAPGGGSLRLEKNVAYSPPAPMAAKRSGMKPNRRSAVKPRSITESSALRRFT